MYFRTFCVFFLSVYLSSENAEAWVNYKINLQVVQTDYINKDFVIFHDLAIKKHNRTFTYGILNGTILSRIDNITMTSQAYRQSNGRYKEYFPKVTVEGCAILEDGPMKESGFVGRLVSTLKKPLLEIIFAKGQKMPRSCPVLPDNYYAKGHIDEEKFPAFLLPEGKWMVTAAFKVNNDIDLGNGKLFFDIVNFHSEKQKKQMG